MTFCETSVILIEQICIFNFRLEMKGKNGLWKMLIDRNLYKKDLVMQLNISSATMAKMGKGESVSMDVMERICKYMDCNIGDIMSFEKENEEGNK